MQCIRVVLTNRILFTKDFPIATPTPSSLEWSAWVLSKQPRTKAASGCMPWTSNPALRFPTRSCLPVSLPIHARHSPWVQNDLKPRKAILVLTRRWSSDWRETVRCKAVTTIVTIFLTSPSPSPSPNRVGFVWLLLLWKSSWLLGTFWILWNPRIPRIPRIPWLMYSIGERSYLACPKGQLTENHMLIIPVIHRQNTLLLDEETLKEMNQFKMALIKYFMMIGFRVDCSTIRERLYWCGREIWQLAILSTARFNCCPWIPQKVSFLRPAVYP